MVDARACRSASTSPAARSWSCSSSRRHRRRRCATRVASIPGEKVVQQYGDAGRAPDADPAAAGGRPPSRARASSRAALQVVAGAAEGGPAASSRSSAASSSARSSAHDLQRKGIYATLASLLGIMVYIAFRFRLDFAVGAMAASIPRRARHAGVPDVLRLRAVAERRRRHPDDHRLLGERHDRHLRPRAREPALAPARAAERRRSTRASTRRCRGR